MFFRITLDYDTLANEIVGKIPEKHFVSKTDTFLDPAFAGGQFLKAVARRLNKYGHSIENIRSRLFGYEDSIAYLNHPANYSTTMIANLSVVKYLEFLDMGKLDGCVVLMNPPYLKRTWLKFVEKVADLNPSIIATINPDPTNNKSDFGNQWRTICTENGLIDRTDVTHHFPNVSSGRISSFIMDTNKQVDTALFKSDDPLFDSILEKVTTDNPTSFVTRGAQAVAGYGNKTKAHNISEVKDSVHIFSSIMNCGKDGLTIKYSDKKVEYKKHFDNVQGNFVIMNRFFGKNNPDPAYLIEDMENYNLSYDCLGFKLHKGETVENFMSVYSSITYRYVMNKMRNGGFDMNQGNFMRLVRLDLSKTWSEQEIQKELNLTDEEIDRINQGN